MAYNYLPRNWSHHHHWNYTFEMQRHIPEVKWAGLESDCLVWIAALPAAFAGLWTGVSPLHFYFFSCKLGMMTELIGHCEDPIICVCLCAHSHVQLCNPMDYSPLGSSFRGIITSQEYWSGLPFPTTGDLPCTAPPGKSFANVMTVEYFTWRLVHSK